MGQRGKRIARGVRIALIATALVGTGVAAPACASRGARGGGQAVEVRVRNSLIPATSLTVSMLPATGVRWQVGFVAPSETKSLRVERSLIGMHRLLAETTDGSAIASRQFSGSDVTAVEWDVGMNSLRVIGPR